MLEEALVLGNELGNGGRWWLSNSLFMQDNYFVIDLLIFIVWWCCWSCVVGVGVGAVMSNSASLLYFISCLWLQPQDYRHCTMFCGCLRSESVIYTPDVASRRQLIAAPTTKVGNHYKMSPWKLSFWLWLWSINRLIDVMIFRHDIFQISLRLVVLYCLNVHISFVQLLVVLTLNIPIARAVTSAPYYSAATF